MDKNDVQDVPLEVESALKSLVHEHLRMDTDSTSHIGKKSVAKKKNRIKGKTGRMSVSKDGLQSDGCKGIAISSEGSKEDTESVSASSIELFQYNSDVLSSAVGDVATGKSSAKLSDKSRPKIVKKVWQRKESIYHEGKEPISHEGKELISHEGQHTNLTLIHGPSLKLKTKNEKFEDELEEEVDGSFVCGKETTEAYVTKIKSRIKHLSLDRNTTQQVSLPIIRKEENLLEGEGSRPLLARAPVGYSRRKLLILDINGLLADIVNPPPKECKADINISRRAIFKRPFCSDFLEFCFDKFDVGIWSSRSKKIIDRVVDYLLGDMKHELLFCWDLSHCTETSFRALENRKKALVFKDLRKIWDKYDHNLPWNKGDYNESNTLLVDDSPYKALLNPKHTAIFPHSYYFGDGGDNSLGPGGDIRVYLEELAAADDAQKYVKNHPFGQKAINATSPSWHFYCKVLSSCSSASKGKYLVPLHGS